MVALNSTHKICSFKKKSPNRTKLDTTLPHKIQQKPELVTALQDQASKALGCPLYDRYAGALNGVL